MRRLSLPRLRLRAHTILIAPPVTPPTAPQMHSRCAALLAFALAASGCAQTMTFTPRPSPVQVELEGLPAARVDVEVTDLRGEKGPGDEMVALVREQVERSLAQEDSGGSARRGTLIVDIVEHRAFFDLGNWNGSTRFRARLVSPAGAVAGPWDGTGTARRSNMLGSRTAAAVAQDSYNAAIADLLSQLRSARMPE